MAETDPTKPYIPIGEEPSGISIPLRRVLPVLVVGALVAIFFFAMHAGGGVVPRTPIRADMIPFLAVFVIFLVVAVSSARQAKRRSEARRAAFDAFAASVGGRVAERPLTVTPSGWEGGTVVEYEIQGRPVRLSANRGRQSVYGFRLAADIVLRRDFQFELVPGGRAMRFVLSKTFLVPALSMAAKGARSAEMKAGAGTHPALLVERLRYLADDPVTTGDPEFDRAYLVKASDRDAARDLVCDPSVRAALTALTQAARGFQMGAESEAAAGPGRLVITVSTDPSPALFAAMDAALRAALASLERLDRIEGGTRGVA
ncbi:MAG: hypothetical protein ACM3PF_06600 [Bacteroidota bacterium]